MTSSMVPLQKLPVFIDPIPPELNVLLPSTEETVPFEVPSKNASAFEDPAIDVNKCLLVSAELSSILSAVS